MFKVFDRFKKENFYNELETVNNVPLPDTSTDDLGVFVKDPLLMVSRSRHNFERLEDGKCDLSRKTKVFTQQLAEIGSFSSDYYQDVFSSVLYRAEQRVGQKRDDLGFWVKVAEDLPVQPVRQKKGVFFMDDVAPVYSYPKNDRICDEMYTVIDSRSLDKVRKRLEKKEVVAKMMNVPVHCVPISMTTCSLPDGILKSPGSEMKSLGDVREPRRVALERIFRDVEPTTVVTVDAESGGGVKTYPHMCKTINKVILLSFSNTNSFYASESRYEIYLKNERPDVVVVKERFDFTSDEISLRKFQILNYLRQEGVDFKRDLFMFTYYPGAICLSKFFSNCFAMVMSERVLKGAKNIDIAELYDDDARNSELISKYYCEHVGNDYSKIKDVRFFMPSCGRVVSFSSHNVYLDRVLFDDEVAKYGGHYETLQEYAKVRVDSCMNVYFKIGVRDVKPSAIQSFKIQGFDEPIKIHGFSAHNCNYVRGYKQPISRYLFRKYITLGDGSKRELPRQGIYYVVKDEFDRIIFYDYRDTRLTYAERRARLIKFGLSVVEMSGDPKWKTSYVVWPLQATEFMSIYVDRDEYLSAEDQELPSCSIVELPDVYVCKEHGLSYGKGSVYISDFKYSILGKDSSMRVSKSYQLKRTQNYKVHYEDARLKYMCVKECDGLCIPVVKVFEDCRVTDDYSLYGLADLFSADLPVCDFD